MECEENIYQESRNTLKNDESEPNKDNTTETKEEEKG